jgi:hypothetical protein
MKNIFLTTIILFTCFAVSAKRKKSERVKVDKLPAIKVAYLGRFAKPSMIFGAEIMLRKSQYSQSRFKRTRETFATLNFVKGNDADLYNTAYVYAEFLKRTNYNSSGLFREFGVGFGMGRTINFDQPDTYIRNADGTETIKKPKTDFIMLTINVGVGYNFMPKFKLPMKVYVRSGLYPIYHNGWPYQLFPPVEIGVNTSLAIFKNKK